MEAEPGSPSSAQIEFHSHDNINTSNSNTGQKSEQICNSSQVNDYVSDTSNLQAEAGSDFENSQGGYGCLEVQTKPENMTSFSEFLRELGQESKMVILQYSQTFADSEAFEQQACQHVADLTTYASMFEQNVNEQKKLLHSRLKEILKILSIDTDDNF
ncbi:hypothetical protein EGW08_009707 [Elysia chlorotica]|uniref:Uncharacterized protein n=1 Tax=Elysia chlorotica TaxID=188477 RepID=A0A3S1BF13_ELYCH|nr:hypothetical protein EGW08_009707 [Elysia chlorotica]